MPARAALCVFVKNPVAGKVKTRLAVSVGNDQALAIYHKLLDHTASIVDQSGFDLHVFYSDHIPEKEQWFTNYTSRYVQTGTNLGDRMSHALDAILGEYEKTVLIGSDCGELTAPIINEAFQTLDLVDLVLGPAQDGGYYLVGLKQHDPSLFAGIRWSTSEVLLHTLRNAFNMSCDVGLLATLNDVDTVEDWLKLDW